MQAFELTAKGVRANVNWALRMAYENGHLEVAQWLEQAFNIAEAELER